MLFCIAVVNQVPKVWFSIICLGAVSFPGGSNFVYILASIYMLDNCLGSWISGCLCFPYPFQSWIPSTRQRLGWDEQRRAQGFPAVHDRLLIAAARRTRQSPAASDDRPKGRQQRRRQLPVGQHLRTLPQAARIFFGRNTARAPACCHQGEGILS